MRDVIAEAKSADAEYLRTVMPVVVDYVRQITVGADLPKLRRAAERAGAVCEVAVIDALIAAGDAVARASEVVRLAALPDFVVRGVGLCVAVVCTSLPNGEATARLNVAHPTGISTRWELADRAFPSGDLNGHPCPEHPATHRHLLFHC